MSYADLLKDENVLNSIKSYYGTNSSALANNSFEGINGLEDLTSSGSTGTNWLGYAGLALDGLSVFNGYQQNQLAKQALADQRSQYEQYMSYMLDEQAMNKATARTAATDTANFLQETGLGGSDRIASYQDLATTLQ